LLASTLPGLRIDHGHSVYKGDVVIAISGFVPDLFPMIEHANSIRDTLDIFYLVRKNHGSVFVVNQLDNSRSDALRDRKQMMVHPANAGQGRAKSRSSNRHVLVPTAKRCDLS
jgi:hypothetical protein